jgi:ribonuclease R
LVGEWYGETTINSDHRFAYEDAQKVLDDGEGPLAKELKIANRIAEKLRKERFKNGSIAFETDEVKFKLDENGRPLGVYIKARQATNLMIEDLMLLANRKVAEFVTKGAEKKQDRAVFVYRVHDQPKPDRIQELANFLKAIGYELDKNHDGAIEASDINALFKEIEGSSEQGLIETAAVRSMAKAVYSTKNIGHFGLAFKFYTHFTSPIRRYPDMMVHRLLKRAIKGDFAKISELGKYDLECAHASEREVAAVEAERDSVRYKQIEYLAPHLGETFDGIISGVAEWGLYIAEIETKAEGLLRIRDLGDDFYTHDDKNYCLRGERKKKVYSLGDKIRVTLAETNLGEKQITWKLAVE